MVSEALGSCVEGGGCNSKVVGICVAGGTSGLLSSDALSSSAVDMVSPSGPSVSRGGTSSSSFRSKSVRGCQLHMIR